MAEPSITGASRRGSKGVLSSLQKGLKKFFTSGTTKTKAKDGGSGAPQAKDVFGPQSEPGPGQSVVLGTKPTVLLEPCDEPLPSVLVDATDAGSSRDKSVSPSQPAKWPPKKSLDAGVPAAAASLLLNNNATGTSPHRRPSAQPTADIPEVSTLIAEPYNDNGLEVRALVSRCRVPARDLSLGAVPVVSARSLHAALSATDLPVVVARVAMGDAGMEYSQRVKHTSKELPPVCAAAQKLASAKQVQRERGSGAGAGAARPQRRAPRRAITSVNLGEQGDVSRRRMSVVLQELKQLAARQKAGRPAAPQPARHVPMLTRKARRASAGPCTPTPTIWSSSVANEEASSISLLRQSGTTGQATTPDMLVSGLDSEQGRQKPDLVELFCMLAKTTRHLRANNGPLTDETTGRSQRVSQSGTGPAGCSGSSGGGGRDDSGNSMSQDLELLQQLLRARSGLSSGPSVVNKSVHRKSSVTAGAEGASGTTSTAPSGSLNMLKMQRSTAGAPSHYDAAAPPSSGAAAPLASNMQPAAPTAGGLGCVPLLGGAPVSVVTRAIDDQGGMFKAFSSPNLRGLAASGSVSLRVRPKLRNDPDAPCVGGRDLGGGSYDDTSSSTTTLVHGNLPTGSALSNGLSTGVSTTMTGFSGGVSSTLSGGSGGLERAGAQTMLLHGYSSNLTGVLPTVMEAANGQGAQEGNEDAVSAAASADRQGTLLNSSGGTLTDPGTLTCEYAPSTAAPSTRTSRPRHVSSPGTAAMRANSLRRAKTALGCAPDDGNRTSNTTPRESFDIERATPALAGGEGPGLLARDGQSCGSGQDGSAQGRPRTGTLRWADEMPPAPVAEPDAAAAMLDHQGRLEPVYVNEAASVLFGIASMIEAQALLDIQMGRNPSLMLVLEEMVTQLLAGQSQVLTHYIPCYHASVLAPARAAAKAGRAPPLRPHTYARRSTNLAPPSTMAGSFLQIQVMAVRLALSDYQCEAALFVHYRSVKVPGPGVPGSLRASLDLSAAMNPVRNSGRISTVPVVPELSELDPGAKDSHGPSLAPTPGHSATHDTILSSRMSTVSLAAWTPGKAPSVPSMGGASSGAAGVGVWVTEAAAAGPPQTAIAFNPIPERSSYNRSSRTQAIGPIASDNAIFMAMQAQLQLMYAALAHSPCIMTVLAMDGRVMFQNGRSVDYCGLVYNRTTQVGRPLTHPLHTLRRLFALDPSALENLLGAVSGGQLWSGLVRMPACVDLAADYGESGGTPWTGDEPNATVALSKTASGRCAVQVMRSSTKYSSGLEGPDHEADSNWTQGLLGDIEELADSLSTSPAAALITAMSTAGSLRLKTQGISPQLTKEDTHSSEKISQLAAGAGGSVDSVSLPPRLAPYTTSVVRKHSTLSRGTSRDLSQAAGIGPGTAGSTVLEPGLNVAADPESGAGAQVESAGRPVRGSADVDAAAAEGVMDSSVCSAPATVSDGRPALHVARAMLSSYAEPAALTDALEAALNSKGHGNSHSTSTGNCAGPSRLSNAGTPNTTTTTNNNNTTGGNNNNIAGGPSSGALNRRVASAMPPVAASAYTAHALNSGNNMQLRQLPAAQEDISGRTCNARAAQVPVNCSNQAAGTAVISAVSPTTMARIGRPSLNGLPGQHPMSDPNTAGTPSVGLLGPAPAAGAWKGNADGAGFWAARRATSVSQQHVAVSRLLSGTHNSLDRGTSQCLVGAAGSGLTAFEQARMSVDLVRTTTGASAREVYNARGSLDIGGAYSSLSGTSGKAPSGSGTAAGAGPFARRSRILVAQSRPMHRSDAFLEQEQELTGSQRALKLLQSARGSNGASPAAGLAHASSFHRTNSGSPLCDPTGQQHDPAALAVTSSLYAMHPLAPPLVSSVRTSGTHSRCQSADHPTVLCPMPMRVSMGAADAAAALPHSGGTGRSDITGTAATGGGTDVWGRSSTRSTSRLTGTTTAGDVIRLSGHTSSNPPAHSPRDISAAYASNDSQGNPDAIWQAAHSAPLQPLPDGAVMTDNPLAAARESNGQESLGGERLSGPAPILGDLGSYQWHDIEAHRVPNAMTGQDMLVLVHYDVTHYVNAELEVKRVLDVEHKLLEEIFPRHVLQVMATSTTSNVLYNRQQSAASDPSLAGLAGLRGSTGDGGTQGMPGGIHHAASRDLMDVPGSLSMQQARPTLHAMRLSGQPPALRASSEVPAAESTVTSQNGNAQHANSGMLVIDGTDTGDMCGTQWVGDLGRPTGPSSPTPDPSASGHRTHHSTTASAVTNSSRLPLPPMQLGSCASFAHRGKTSEAGNGAAAVTPLSRTVSDAGALASMVGSPSSKPLPAVGVHAGPRVNGRPGSQMGPGTSGHHGPSASELQGHLARHHEQVTVLFADIKSFTSMCNEVPPHVVMSFLNSLFTAFDELVEAHGVYKVETIGDCYMVAGGLLARDADGFYSVATHLDPDHARKVFAFAVDMLRVARTMPMPGSGGATVELRVGIHSGPCMSGVVGRKMPRFCLFGDTVNTASRMESTGVPGAIHVSEETWGALGGDGQLAEDERWQARGVEAKGKGRLNTYLWQEML